VLAGLLTAAHAQPGPELLWSFQANGNMQAIAAIPDISGDGEPDIVFEGYENGPSGVDRVFAIRGNSSGVGSVIWSARPIGGASSGGGWGDNCLRLGPDLNGDGTPEVLLGTAWGGRTAYALNGGTGVTLWSYDTYAHYGSNSSGWIYAMDDLGSDLNGDVVAALGDNSPVSPRIVAYAGDDGHVLWQRPPQGSIWNLTFINDITGDGVSDVAIGFNTTRACRVCSGLTGATIWNTPSSDWTWAVDRIADVTEDGVNDVVGDFDGYVHLLNGVTGAIFWSWLNPTADKVMTIRGVPDLNGNGIADVVAGTGGDVYALEGNREATAVPNEAAFASGLRVGPAWPNPASGPITWSLAAGVYQARVFVDGRVGAERRDVVVR